MSAELRYILSVSLRCGSMQWKYLLWYILCFLLLSGIPCTVLATVITVHEGENLQAAINRATAGDTLVVETGTYYGNFRVATPLTLQGIGMPVLDGKNTLNNDTITLCADGVHLEGFVITNSRRAGINVSSNGNVILFNQVIHNDKFGIAVWGANNRLEGNTCTDTHGTLSQSGIGIYLSNAHASRIVNNTLTENKKNGIQISYSSPVFVEGNRISRTGGSSSGGYGIRLENSAFAGMRNNEIRDCLTYGLYLYNASHSTFQDLLLDNTTTGIALSGTDNNTFDRITVQNNHLGMDISYSGSVLPNRVFRSSFSSNAHQVLSMESSVEWNSVNPLPYRYEGRYYENFTGNYWDTYPYHDEDGDGIGDQTYSVSTADTDLYPLIAPLMSFEWDPDPPDTTPPGTVTNLTGSSPDPNTFCWTWEDPPDKDLDHLVLYLNDTFLLNLSPGVEMLALDTLYPSTEYTLGVCTYDTTGNGNINRVNYSGCTVALPDPSPSPTGTETPTTTVTTPPEIPPTSPPTTSAPPTRTGRAGKTTRYFPPPSTDSPLLIPASPTVLETDPPLSQEIDGTILAPETTSETPGTIPPWTAEIPAPVMAVPLAAAILLGYRFLRNKR
jgi:nitrous oxidase accessory protein